MVKSACTSNAGNNGGCPGVRQLLYLSRADVESVGLPPDELVSLMEKLFRAKAAGEVELPPKPGIHPRHDSFIHAMPAYISSLDAAGLKWVSGYPGNTRRGLPYINGLFILNDPDTGLPLAVMDATWITAMRTAAVSALAARLLAPSGPLTVAILGLGVQGRSHLQVLSGVLRIARFQVWDIRPPRIQAFVEDAARLAPGVAVVACSEPRQAVSGAHVVITAGPILRQPQPVVEAQWLAEGVLLLPIDFDSMVTPAAMAACSLALVDDVPQFAYYRTVGYFAKTPEPAGELADVVSGRHPGRRSRAERILSMNLGLAMEDVGLGHELFHRAKGRGVGTWLPL